MCGIRKDHRGNALMDICEQENANKPRICEKHKDKALDLYCRFCKATICSSCLIRDHCGHSVTDVSEFLDKTRKHVMKELEKFSIFEKIMTDKKASLDKYTDRFLDEIDATEKAINDLAEELMQLIARQKKSLAEELCSIKDRHLKEVFEKREAMEDQSADITKAIELCNAIALIEHPIDISGAMAEFRTVGDKVVQNYLAQIEHPLPAIKVLFQPTISGEDQLEKNIIGSITAGEIFVHYRIAMQFRF